MEPSLDQLNPEISDKEIDPSVSSDVRRRMDLIFGVIPEIDSISPEQQIPPEWCFGVTLKKGTRFLVYCLARLSGLGEADQQGFFDAYALLLDRVGYCRESFAVVGSTACQRLK